MTYAPILLFVYNRPEHTRQVVSSLLRNQEAAESPLFIYADQSKTPDNDAAVQEVRRYIHSISGFKSITIIERESNWGLARNIIDGVTTQVNEFGRVIVLEDDLIVAPYFLKFMNDALETYQDEQRVGHIQACDFTKDTSLPDTFLIKWTGSWGWGTWKRAWKYFNPDGKNCLPNWKSASSHDISTSTVTILLPGCYADKLQDKTTHGPSAGMPACSLPTSYR